jgi:hypothetical protein
MEFVYCYCTSESLALCRKMLDHFDRFRSNPFEANAVICRYYENCMKLYEQMGDAVTKDQKVTFTRAVTAFKVTVKAYGTWKSNVIGYIEIISKIIRNIEMGSAMCGCSQGFHVETYAYKGNTPIRCFNGHHQDTVNFINKTLKLSDYVEFKETDNVYVQHYLKHIFEELVFEINKRPVSDNYLRHRYLFEGKPRVDKNMCMPAEYCMYKNLVDWRIPGYYPILPNEADMWDVYYGRKSIHSFDSKFEARYRDIFLMNV